MTHPDKEHYLEACNQEINQLIKNNTWTLVPKPNQKVLQGRWVFNKKIKPDSSIKYKARWVVKGYMQVYGINYKETFASTAKPDTIRILLYIATYYNWSIEQWDVKQAFPNAPIDTEVYVEQPQGFIDQEKPNWVCKLNKALYGLKQSARQWQLFLTDILVKKLKFCQSVTDTAIYYKEDIILAVHVDDILVFTKNYHLTKILYQSLTSQGLEISNLGEIKHFLGIQIKR